MKELGVFMPRSFAVVGAGPVGCALAAFLSDGGHEVTLCDLLPQLLEPATTSGITVDGANTLHAKVTRTCTSIGDLAGQRHDVIFVAVKTNALASVAPALKRVHEPGSYVVSWQNGIDTERLLAENIGAEHVLRAVVNFGCRLVAPGHVRMTFHHTPHHLQEVAPAARAAAVGIVDALGRCGLDTQHTDNIVSMAWRKAAMNSSMNSVCAVTGVTMSKAMSDPAVYEIVSNLVKECIRVARANEISMGWDFFDYAMGYMRRAGDHKPSMLVDIEEGRRTEIEYLNAKFVEYGARAGVETPYNGTMSALVRALEARAS